MKIQKAIGFKLKGLLLIAFSFYLISISYRLGSYQDSVKGLGILISQDINWAIKQVAK